MSTRKYRRVRTPQELTKWRKSHIFKIQTSGWNAIRKRVMCVETGQIYDSAKDAAHFVGVIPQTIRNAANPNQTTTPTAGGYRWVYLQEGE